MYLGPPDLSDKLQDWQLLSHAGGQALIDGKDILDVGPSYGIDTYMFARRAKTYTTVDSDPTVIENFRRQFGGLSNTRLIEQNLCDPLPFPAQSFDMVIDFGTLDNVLGGLRPHQEAFRVLRSKGVFVCSFANRSVLTEPTSACGDEQRFYPREIEQALRAVGASAIRVFFTECARGGLIAIKT